MSELALLDVPIARISLADSVYEKLLEAIASGRFAGGTEFSEVEIARHVGVSRTPVHEAVIRLIADGFLVQTPERKLRVVQFAGEEVAGIYQMRRLLEGEAARLAATRFDAKNLAALREGAESLLRSMDDEDWCDREIEYDLQFHDAIAGASGNALLQRDIARYRLLVRGLCRLTGTRENLQAALREHVQIIESLEQRDSRAACRAMQQHVDARLAGVQKALEQGSLPGASNPEGQNSQPWE